MSSPSCLARFVFAALFVGLGSPGIAAPSEPVAATAAIAAIPPYAVREADGDWSGPAVDLFRAAADRAGTRFRLVEMPVGAQAEALRRGAQVAFPAYPGRPGEGAEAPRSLPIDVDSVGLIGGAPRSGFVAGLANLFTFGVLKVAALLSVLLLVIGSLFWLAERRSNETVRADGHRVRGIGHGFWWAGVTMTTIGDGDLVPGTTAGRVVAMVWMLFSMALTAILTAYLVSITDMQQGSAALADAVRGERVGIVAGGPVAPAMLAGAGAVRRFVTVDAAVAALDAKEVDLVAYPYLPATQAAGDRDVVETQERLMMPAVAVAPGAAGAMRPALDRVILSPAWQQRMRQLDRSTGR